MGNTLLDESRKEDPVEIFEQWLEQNPDLVGRQVLAHNKLFESNRFKYCERSIKLAVFFRRDDTQLGQHLQIFGRILAFVRKYRCMHVLPMRLLSLREFDRKEVRYEQNLIVAVRQFAHATLEQRLEARPLASEEQKLWLIYQMVLAVYTVHDHFNAYHGNLRASNFLLTNYHYLLLTDFASYKPTYILQDSEQGLSQFRLYYASSIEKCNLAPEKLTSRDRVKPYQLFSPRLFAPQPSPSVDLNASTNSPRKPRRNGFEQGSEAQKDLDAMKRMDIFSLGLSILQVLSDGDSPLSYESLVRSQKEGLDLTAIIQSATKGMTSKERLRELLTGMLKENPLERSNILAVQVKFQGCVEQQIYILLWCCLSAFGKTSFSSCDLRIHLLYSLLNFIENEVRMSGYRFTTKPPRCLSGFKSLKIFAEMLEKGLIFAPRVREIRLIDLLLQHCQRTEPVQVAEQQEQLYCEDDDERRSFFIQSSKKSKIAKRLSFASDPTPRKVLCPPAYAEVQHLKQHNHTPVRLTHLSLRRPRIEELLQEYKENQSVREERIRRERYYRSGEIIIKVVFACIRGCKYVASKLLGLELIGLVARDCTDAVLLRVLLPTYMALAQDSDVSVGRQAFLGFLALFYHFADPFANEEDVHYCEGVLEFFIGIVKQSKLRPTLFAQFRQVYGICEWLEVHSRKFRGAGRASLHRLVQVVKVHYGSYSREQVRILLSGNVPEHLLPDMFEFYISLLNTDRLQGLRLSLTLASAVSPLTHRHVLDVLDSCVEGALDESGMGLFYAIKYFTLRRSTSHFVVKKIAPHAVNPSKWIRDQAINYVRMCLNEYPPTKNYFLFKDIFDPPFPLRPEDVDEDVLLPIPLRETDLDLRDRKLRLNRPCLTAALFGEYLRGAKASKTDKRREEEVELWTQAARSGRQAVSFENYVKRQLQILYENNFLFYVMNMSARFSVDKEKGEKDKQQENGYPELAAAFRKLGRDLNSIDHEKKELFESFQGTINSSFEKLLTKKNRDGGQTVADKVRLADALLVVGEVLCKFQMLKVRPIPRLGSYTRSPLLPEKLPRPKGILLAQISEHTEAVTCLEKVADQFILSGSSDGTLRVFDSRKLQMNMTLGSEAWIEMRGQGEERVRVSAICAFEQTYAAVVGSSRGQIRIYPLERLPSRNRQDETVKYNANGELQKLTTLNNQLQNQCFCYVTAQGNLGVQDIRVKVRSMSCSIGRERGVPRALCSTARSSILVGTIDGYIVNFDLRYNVISSVLQLRSDRQALPVTGIHPCPPQQDKREQLFALTYPGRHYEYSCFDILQTRAEFPPERQYTSAGPEEIVITPYLEDRTSDQQFKLCRNGLIWRKGYEQLSDFSKSFSIYDYLSDPLTRKEAKIREVWLDNCKNRYNQIASLYGKRSLPFLQHLPSGILTAFNPSPTTPSLPRPPFALLTQRKEQKDTFEIDRFLTNRQTATQKLFSFSGEETKDFLTCCKVLPTMVAVGCRNSLIKVYI